MKLSFILCSKHNSLEGKEHETNSLRKMSIPGNKSPVIAFLKKKKKKNLYCIFKTRIFYYMKLD